MKITRKTRKKDMAKLCFIHMKDAELWLYSPEFYSSKEEAMQALMEDCKDIAHHNGYKDDQIFYPGVGELMNRVTWIWDNYEEIMSNVD